MKKELAVETKHGTETVALEVDIDAVLLDTSFHARRRRCGQYGAPAFGIIAATAYTINSAFLNYRYILAEWIIYIFGFLYFFSYGLVLYKNINFRILKRLFTEVNVIMIIIFTLMNTGSDAIRTPNHAIMGFMYLGVVLCVICLDAIRVKSRAFVLTFGVTFLLLTTFFWFGHIFIWDTTEILFYGIRNEPIYKSAYKRWIFTQLILFSAKGLKTLLRDKDMQIMLFVTGNIYRDTGKSMLEHVTENRGGDIIKDKALLNISPDNCTNGKSLDSKFKRGSIKLFGIEELVDEFTITRVRRIEILSAIMSFTGFGAYMLNNVFSDAGILNNIFVTIIFISGSSVFLMLFGMMYKNVSLTVLKRLLREISVWILLVSVVLNFIMECARPATPVVDPVAAFVFLFCVVYFIALDCLKLKSRRFVLLYGLFFTIVCMFVIFQNTIGENNIGIVLFESFHGSIFYKRYVKRTIFIQVFSFAFSALWTSVWDKNMELIMFCKGPVYIATGTSRPEQHTSSTNNDKRRQQKKRNDNYIRTV